MGAWLGQSCGAGSRNAVRNQNQPGANTPPVYPCETNGMTKSLRGRVQDAGSMMVCEA